MLAIITRENSYTKLANGPLDVFVEAASASAQVWRSHQQHSPRLQQGGDPYSREEREKRGGNVRHKEAEARRASFGLKYVGGI